MYSIPLRLKWPRYLFDPRVQGTLLLFSLVTVNRSIRVPNMEAHEFQELTFSLLLYSGEVKPNGTFMYPDANIHDKISGLIKQ